MLASVWGVAAAIAMHVDVHAPLLPGAGNVPSALVVTLLLRMRVCVNPSSTFIAVSERVYLSQGLRRSRVAASAIVACRLPSYLLCGPAAASNL